MLDYEDYRQVKAFEERVKKLNFEIVPCRYHDAGSSRVISIIPSDDNYPSYSRDAAIYSGTIENLNHFLAGIEWMDEYHQMIKATTQDQVSKLEQKIRNKYLMNKLADRDEHKKKMNT